MITKEIEASIAELQRTSKTSLGMVILGVVFLGSTVIYSVTRVQPLREEVAQLEAKRTELARLAAAAEHAARPAAPSQQLVEGWIYLGRVSADGEWAPQSDRVESAKDPSLLIAGMQVSARQDVSLVDDISAEPNDQHVSTQSTSATALFLKPATAVKVLDIRKQDSVGNGKLVWARIKVSSDALLQVG
jgi:hypothetical protein